MIVFCPKCGGREITTGFNCVKCGAILTPPVIPGNFTSNAEWPEGTISGTLVSSDTHETRGLAQEVCRMMEGQGFGGDAEVFPVRTWVEVVPGKPGECEKWTIEEDIRLLSEIAAGTEVEEISLNHGRTEGAIESRITKHIFQVQFQKRLSEYRSR